MRKVQDVPLGALEQYQREVRWIAPLMDGEETQLLQSIERGKVEGAKSYPDACILAAAKRAQTRLLEGYLGLVFGIAKRYEPFCREMELLDLVQEGNLGLLQAIEGHDGRMDDASFATWAYSWVRGMMRRALLSEGAIHLPQRKVEAVRRMEAISMDLYCLLGREPTLEEIAREMGIADREVRELVVLRQLQVVSLDAPVDEDGDVMLAEVIEDTSITSDEDVPSLEDVLKHLSEQERAVILVRYGFGDGQPCTQAETAQLLGMKLRRVQELDWRARIRLRRVLELQAS